MFAVKNINLISEEEYLQGELNSEVKHQLIDGCAYAMAGASKNHERIASNLSRKFGNHLEDSACEPFSSEVKVKAGLNFYYPDVMVVCDDKTENEYYTEFPAIIVEVISKSTRRMDETTKLMSYINLPSLQEYVLIEQDFVDIQIIRRSQGWLPKHYFLGDELTFEAIDLTLTVEEIYQRVQNEDMLEFLKVKNL